MAAQVVLEEGVVGVVRLIIIAAQTLVVLAALVAMVTHAFIRGEVMK